MAFDIAGARKAGYSDAEIAGFLSQKGASDFDVGGALKSGYSPTEVLDHLAPPKGLIDKVKTFAGKVYEDPPASISGLASLPRRAIQEAGDLQRTGEYPGGEGGQMPAGLEGALLTAGTGLVGPRGRMGPAAALKQDAAQTAQTIQAQLAPLAAETAPKGAPQSPAQPQQPAPQAPPAALSAGSVLHHPAVDAGLEFLPAYARAAIKLARRMNPPPEAPAPVPEPQAPRPGPTGPGVPQAPPERVTTPWGSAPPEFPQPRSMVGGLDNSLHRVQPTPPNVRLLLDRLNNQNVDLHRMPGPPPPSVPGLVQDLNASDLGELARPPRQNMPATIDSAPRGNANGAQTPPSMNMPGAPPPLSLPPPGLPPVMRMPAPAPQLALPKPSAPGPAAPALPPGFSPERIQQLLMMQKQSMQGRPQSPQQIRPQPAPAPADVIPQPVPTAPPMGGEDIPAFLRRAPDNSVPGAQPPSPAPAAPMPAATPSAPMPPPAPAPLALPAPVVAEKALIKITKRPKTIMPAPKDALKSAAEITPAKPAQTAEIKNAPDDLAIPDFLKRSEDNKVPTSLKSPEPQRAYEAGHAAGKLGEVSNAEPPWVKASQDLQASWDRGLQDGVLETRDAYRKQMGQVPETRKAPEPAKVAEPAEITAAKALPKLSRQGQKVADRMSLAQKLADAHNAKVRAAKPPEAPKPPAEPALSDVTSSRDKLLKSLKDVQETGEPITSADGDRSIDFMKHTSSGMGHEEAAGHIADMMTALGKPIRDRGDFVSYVSAMTQAKDAMATKMARELRIDPEKMIPHIRAITDRASAKHERDMLMELEPTQASRITGILTDKLIKQLWKK